MHNTVIMIVDDDPDTLLLMSQFVSSIGYKVVTAGSRSEAMGILVSDVRVDVLLTDFNLQDGTGSDILREMSVRSPRVMTVLFSGFSKFPPSLGEGFDDYITKPIEYDLLRRTLMSVLEVRKQRMDDAEKGERAA